MAVPPMLNSPLSRPNCHETGQTQPTLPVGFHFRINRTVKLKTNNRYISILPIKSPIKRTASARREGKGTTQLEFDSSLGAPTT